MVTLSAIDCLLIVYIVLLSLIIIAYGSTPYAGMNLRKMAATLNVHKWHTQNVCIMVYGSTPYVGMAPKKIGPHYKSAQMTLLKYLR